MKNPRITSKERGLLKGALRRVFSRSELRQEVLKEASIRHSDPKRTRVKHWVRCAECKKPEARSNVAVDHIDPVIPVTSSMEEMSLDEVANRIWCEKKNLQVLCDSCHTTKSRVESKQRRLNKKEKKNVKQRKAT